MIIARYLAKEVIMTQLGVFLVLLLIALSAQLAGLFNKVASGSLHVETVILTFGLKSITIIAFILPLSLYLAVLLALSRLYKDSEMVALTACGTSTLSIMKTVLGVAFLFAVLQAVLTIQLAPWAEEKSRLMFVQAQKSADVQGITAGRFKEMTEGAGVLYVQEIDTEAARMRNIFLQQQREKGEAVVAADSGYQYIEPDNGDRFMVLEKGNRYEGVPGKAGYTIIEFERHGIRIQEKEIEKVTRRFKTMSTEELWGSDYLGHIAEIQWRISSALLCIVLAMLAVPLSKTSHRQGRYAKLAVAIVLYMLATNLLNVARTWLYHGEVPPVIGLWWVHILLVIIAMFLVLRQTGVRHLFMRKQERAS